MSSQPYRWLWLLLVMALNLPARPRVVAYLPNWIDLNRFATNLDYSRITHLNLAFENPVDDLGTLSFNPQNDVLRRAAQAHEVKVLISIGGGGAAENRELLRRYGVLLGESRRASFATNLARYVATHGFDGLDVDLEGPAITEDYGAFITELARVLKPPGQLLTCALSKGYGGGKVPDHALGLFDFVNIMAYDATGPWNPKAPGPHSSFSFATNNVAYWLQRGLAKDRAVLGVPFYGHAFGEAAGKGGLGYASIVAKYPGAEQVDQIGNTIYYNGLPTIRAKSRFVTEQGLGGIMIWSVDADVAGEGSLLKAIHETLNAPGGRKP